MAEQFEKTEEFWEYMKIIYSLCSQYNIFIKSWKKDRSGVAYCGKSEIAIPPPIDPHCMMICFHEIGHIMTTKGTMRTVRSEYHACVYSEEMCEKFEVPIDNTDLLSNKNYVIHHICKGIQTGKATIQSLDPQIAGYTGINKQEWTHKVNQGLTPYINSKGSDWKDCTIVWLEGIIT